MIVCSQQHVITRMYFRLLGTGEFCSKRWRILLEKVANSARKGGEFCSKRWRILLEKVADSARKGGGFCSKRWRILLEKVADSARKGGRFCSKGSEICRTIQTLCRAIPRILLHYFMHIPNKHEIYQIKYRILPIFLPAESAGLY